MTEKVSPITIQKHLKGMDYPANKDEVVQHARDRQAPENVVSLLERLPEQEYSSAKDVQKAVGDLE